MAAQPLPVYTVHQTGRNYVVHHKGAILKTPAGMDMALPTKPLAETIAAEWRAQKDKLKSSSMPMMQLAATAIDLTRANRIAVVEQVAGYASADLLCFRADSPDELIVRQQKIWQPVLDWCAVRFDASLQVVQGIMPIAQSPEALRALRHAVEIYEDFRLTGLKQTAEVTGSLVLGLALVEKHLTSEQVFHAAELDAAFQASKWGDDPVTIKRLQSIRSDVAVCEAWFGLLE